MAESSRPVVRARVRETREITAYGWGVGVFGGLGLLAAANAHGDRRYFFVGLMLALWGGGAMGAFRPRSRLGVVEDVSSGIKIGSLVIPFGASAQIAKGRRGASVAMGYGEGRGAFFEVASMEDARMLVRMVNGDEQKPVTLRLRVDSLRAFTALLGAIAATCGILYAITVGIMGDADSKERFGLPGLCFAIASSFFFLIAQLTRKTVVVGAADSASGVMGAVGAHLDLHAKDAIERTTRGPTHGDDVNDGTPPRVRILVRDAEPTRAWLARIDGAADGGEGYRGLAPSREELASVLADSAARTDLRLAAARVLVRQHGESRDQVLAKLDNQLGDYARLVVDDDADRASEELDRLGPMFMR